MLCRPRRSLEPCGTRRALSLEVFSESAESCQMQLSNQVQTPKEENKRRLSRDESFIPDSPFLTKLSEKVKSIAVDSPSSRHGRSYMQDAGDQENIHLNVRNMNYEVLIEEENHLMSQENTRDEFAFDSLYPKPHLQPQFERSDDVRSGIKASVRCKLSDGYDQDPGLTSSATSCFISPDRKGPDRKKFRAKQNSPERIARRNNALKQSSDSAMSSDHERPRSDSVDSLYSGIPAPFSPRPTLIRSMSSPVQSPSRIQDLPKKLKTSQDECILDCVSVDIVADLLHGGWTQLYKRVIIFDCRYGYEFDGGHIKADPPWLTVYHVPPDAKYNAEKILFGELLNSDRSMTDKEWRQHADRSCGGDDVCVIFHCEFSKSRGPKMMEHIRSLDRGLNQSRYPHLFFPEMYLMKGGYKEFFNKGFVYQNLCLPMSYTPMDDKAYLSVLQEYQKKTACKKKLRRRNDHEEAISGLDSIVDVDQRRPLLL